MYTHFFNEKKQTMREKQETNMAQPNMAEFGYGRAGSWVRPYLKGMFPPPGGFIYKNWKTQKGQKSRNMWSPFSL